MSTGRRHSLLYELYLDSPVWRLRRWWWFMTSDCRCARCRRRLVLHGGGPATVTVHHRTYVRLGRERRGDVELLCGTLVLGLSPRRGLVAAAMTAAAVGDQAAGMPRRGIRMIDAGFARRAPVPRWVPSSLDGPRPLKVRFRPTPSPVPAVLSAEGRTISGILGRCRPAADASRGRPSAGRAQPGHGRPTAAVPDTRAV